MAGVSSELRELLQTLKYLDRNIQKYREEGAPPAFIQIVIQRRLETIAGIERLTAALEVKAKGKAAT
jgi:hypothetical protein